MPRHAATAASSQRAPTYPSPATPLYWRPATQTGRYLKAVKQMGVAEAKRSGARTVEVMKAILTDDDAFGAGQIRADGQMIAPIHLFEVKQPGDRKGKGDVYELFATTPADQAFRPLSESACPMVRKA